eukprot:gene6966-22067_t
MVIKNAYSHAGRTYIDLAQIPNEVISALRAYVYALMPQMLRDYMASRGYNPDTICVFAASDDGNTVLAPYGAPEMRCAYWSYKK